MREKRFWIKSTLFNNNSAFNRVDSLTCEYAKNKKEAIEQHKKRLLEEYHDRFTKKDFIKIETNATYL